MKLISGIAAIIFAVALLVTAVQTYFGWPPQVGQAVSMISSMVAVFWWLTTKF